MGALFDRYRDALANWWEDPGTQTMIVQRPIKIAGTIVLAGVLIWFFTRLIGRLGRQAKERPRSNNIRYEARVNTLTQVSKSAVRVIGWAWAILTIVGLLGINVGPLLASAGIAGVALGFGAQSLVKDFLSGIFMLMEDQYGVGDYIQVGNLSGTVEEVTLRVTTIRDIDGTQWFIRNGEILELGNYSQGYAMARVDFPVGLTNDFNQAIDAIQAAAAHVAEDADLAGMIVETPTVEGITDVQPDHALIRVRVKVAPGSQWDVQRKLFAAIFPKLSAAGITPPQRFYPPAP
ncbi:MAG: mechanosensitive ion channel family protein [Corynebacterium sp.]|nr:mechanosensitive ion channel family protein [Corynebacterium sp.]